MLARPVCVDRLSLLRPQPLVLLLHGRHRQADREADGQTGPADRRHPVSKTVSVPDFLACLDTRSSLTLRSHSHSHLHSHLPISEVLQPHLLDVVASPAASASAAYAASAAVGCLLSQPGACLPRVPAPALPPWDLDRALFDSVMPGHPAHLALISSPPSSAIPPAALLRRCESTPKPLQSTSQKKLSVSS